jgi:hypothetical protein
VNEFPQTPLEGDIEIDKQAGRPLYGPSIKGVIEEEEDGGCM